jgi:hypothetical protein
LFAASQPSSSSHRNHFIRAIKEHPYSQSIRQALRHHVGHCSHRRGKVTISRAGLFSLVHHMPLTLLTLVKFDLVCQQLRDDPENAELQALQEELSNLIDLLNENIAELRPNQAPKSAVKEPSPPPQPEKWSRENHPAFKKAAPPPEEKEEPLVTYHVNDTVMAKWVSGDKNFYQARITSITGSSAAPIYTVKFKNYDNV